MRFSIQRNEIYEALQKVVSVIPSRSTIAMTQNVLFRAEGGQIELMTTDLEITIISTVKAAIQEEGAIAIPGKLIHDIIRELPNVSLSFSSDNNFRATLSSEFGEYKLGGENPAEFPQKPQLANGTEIVLPNDVLKRLVEKTIFAASTDELRPALTGVFFELGNQKIRTVATDGHRLSTITYEDEALPEDGFNAIISTKALNFMLRGLESEGLTATLFSDRYARFHMENTILFARLIEEDYVDYNRVIPTETNFELTVNAGNFLSSVKRVSLFANPITAQVILKIAGEVMQIQAEDIDYGGEAKEEIPCQFSGDEFIIGFNSRYLQNVLRHINAEQTLVDLTRPDSAILLRPDTTPENETQLMLLMPIRLENI